MKGIRAIRAPPPPEHPGLTEVLALLEHPLKTVREGPREGERSRAQLTGRSGVAKCFPCTAGMDWVGVSWEEWTGRKGWHFITKASMLAEFFFALAMLWWEGLRALKIDISS